MDLAALRRDELPAIGRFLLDGLAAHLGRELSVFREHYVDDHAIVLTFRAVTPPDDPLGLRLEGVLLVDLARAGGPPRIDAELLLFGLGGRLRPAGGPASAFVTLHFDADSARWGPARWLGDGPEDWEHVTAPRTDAYDAVVRTDDVA